jgi:hypothetical protein
LKEQDAKLIMIKYNKLVWRVVWSFIGVAIAAIVIVCRSGN